MRVNTILSVAIVVSVIFIGTTQSISQGQSTTELVKRSDVEFIPLNPLRGDQSPKSGKLWGNIRDGVASGMLVTFNDGFQSPPHIHNITYRAVVIDGHIHNDDPAASKMWMGPGSFWTQPLGENHITAAKGKNTTIFLEIQSGPYLVKPAKDAFDSGERPINIDAQNIVWLDATDTTWIDGDGPKLAYLWGKIEGTEKNGTFVKLPPGYDGKLTTAASLMRVVTIQGVMQVQVPGAASTHSLDPGSYFGSKGPASYRLSCRSDDECLFYVHTEGKYQLSSP